jgi:ubiquinone/menaquinone biosynthesis C-methylase UbiE
MLKHARQVNPGVEFLDASIERLPYASNSFDYVMAIEVMRYIRDAEAALGEVFRVLKPGGISLLTYAPKFSTALYPLINQITARAQILHWSKVKQYFHTTGLLNRLYGHAGFRDVEIHGRFIGPFVYLVRLSRPMGSALLRAWEPLDDRLADRPLLKNFSNIFVVAARKPSA